MTTRHRSPGEHDPHEEPLKALARAQRVVVKIDRVARRSGMPYVALLTKPGGTPVGTFKNAAAALRWLQGATQ